MPPADRCHLLELPSLHWPSTFRLSSKRFRLFIAADTTGCAVDALDEFAHSALKSGMVYFSVWGPGCERFHDAVDDVLLEDDLGERLFVGPNAHDTIMTAWHDKNTLDEALDFFLTWARPTAGFTADSDSWVLLSLSNSVWTAELKRRLERKGAP